MALCLEPWVRTKGLLGEEGDGWDTCMWGALGLGVRVRVGAGEVTAAKLPRRASLCVCHMYVTHSMCVFGTDV